MMDHGKNAYKKNARNPQSSGSQMPNFLTFLLSNDDVTGSAWFSNCMSRQLSGEISCFPGEGEKKKGAKKATKATQPPGMAASYGNPNRPMNGWSNLGV